MLNYSTLTIVNDPSVVSAKTTGSGLKKFVVKFGPELKIDADHKASLVGTKAYVAPKLAYAVIPATDLSALSTNDIYRISLYIRLRNQNNPYFSNDWTFKGKPLFVEFNGGATVDEIVSLVKKYSLTEYGYNLVNVRKVTAADVTSGGILDGESGVAADDLLIIAHDQWEMFMDQEGHVNHAVKLEKLTPSANPNGIMPEQFVDQKLSTIVINNGNEGFGDFAHIVKDLRLPSAANLRWQGPHQGDVMGGEPNDDKPLPTGKYTQFTIQYTADRGVLQQTALGGIATSRTVHVFYVESAAVSAFQAALTSAGITNTTAKPV